jgi:hypothetical protein
MSTLPGLVPTLGAQSLLLCAPGGSKNIAIVQMGMVRPEGLMGVAWQGNRGWYCDPGDP